MDVQSHNYIYTMRIGIIFDPVFGSASFISHYLHMFIFCVQGRKFIIDSSLLLLFYSFLGKGNPSFKITNIPFFSWSLFETCK